MEDRRWQVEAIAQSALAVEPGAERARFVADACAGDDELRREVESLLAANGDNKAGVGDGPAEAPAPRAASLQTVVERARRDLFDEQLELVGPYAWGDAFIGRRIGVFELKREIGRGGMGAVYLAERTDGEFRQQVAIKLIKRGMDTDFVVKRFRHERQILAALDHPHVARLLGGGTTEDNLPYFVMEYVEGEPLFRYCDRRRLGTAERLRLFREICGAVEAAHQIRVVHRDLKPSNILIKSDGTPKLLDFGIAKILDPDLAATALEPTATAMRLMTPEYASPEQVLGEPVTRASDIYSLGVMLYELLTGHRPYRFRNRALHEIHRAVCEEAPASPSESLTREDNLLPTAAIDRETSESAHATDERAAGERTTLEIVFRARGTDFEGLRRELAGDLDKIVLKTLRKSPAERYQSAAELEEDIGRYLAKRPVSAESFARAAEAAASAAAPAGEGKESIAILPFKLFGAAAGTTATDGGDDFLSVGLADALVTRLSRVPRLVVRPTSSVLGFADEHDPFAAGGRLSVKFVVDGHIRRAGDRIRVTVQLLNVRTRGVVWAETFDECCADVLALEDSISERVASSLAPHLTGEEERRLQKRGTNVAAAYEAYLRGRFHWNQFTPDSLAKARAAFERATELDPEYALAYVGIADFYLWANIYGMIPWTPALDSAERAARRAIEIDERLGEAYASLALATQNRKRWAEAERLQRHALKLNPNYVHAHEWLAAQLTGLGNFAEGVAEIKIAERLDPLSLRTKTLTAWTLYQARRYDEALERAHEIIELDENYPQGYLQQGNILLALGDTEKALTALRRFDRMIPDFALAKFPLCFALVAAGRRGEAEAVLGELKALAGRTYVKTFFLAMGHAALGQRDEAFRLFEKAYEEDEPWLLWFGTDPMIRTLSDDPRFVRLLERMNNPLAAQFKKESDRPGRQPALAVLPFKLLQLNTGESSEDEFLSTGLTDALITRLSKIRSIVVRPTNAVMRFAGAADAFEAGRELEADFVLAGTIRRAGARVRLTAQLLDTAGKSVDWAEVFDERAADVLALEDSISERVASSLAPRLTGEEERQLRKRETDHPEAYEAYLKGRFYFYLMSEASFPRAIESYERAVALDPDYALAHAAIAEYYIFLAVQCVIPFAEAARRAKEAAERAASIDSQIAEVQNALGFVAINHDFDWATAERHTNRALELNPNSFSVVQWAKTLYLQTGRFEEALKFARRLGELAPDSMMAVDFLAWTEHCSRRFADALASHEQLIGMEPYYAHARMTYSWTLRAAGRFDEAVESALRGVELAPGNPMYKTALAAALADNGEIDSALRVLAEIERASAVRYVSPYMLALVHCALRDKTRAFDELERALDIRDVWLVFVGVEPLFDILRGDPRFDDLLRRMKHPLAP